MPSCRMPGRDHRHRGRRARRRVSATTPRPCRTAARACCTAAYSMLLQDAGRPDPGDALGLRRPRLSRRRAGARPAAAAGRVRYAASADEEALAAVRTCCEMRRHPAGHRECARAVGAQRWAASPPRGATSWCVSPGRGDKDMPTLQRTLLARRRQMNAASAISARHRARPRIKASRARRLPHRGLSAPGEFREHLAAVAAPRRTSLRSACRSPIRWPTASPSSARAWRHWRRA